MKCPLSSIKVETILGFSLLNHTLVGPLSVVGNSLHIISSRTPWRYVRVLNVSKWTSGSFNSSYTYTYNIQNLVMRRKEVTCTVKDESVHWTCVGMVRSTPWSS